MTRSLAQLADAPLWIDDSGSATVTEIGAKARRLKRDRGLSLVIVDYLQLIAARGRFSNRNEEVSSITRGLKALAKELKVPVLVLSQLTRAPEREERSPQLADLARIGRHRAGRRRGAVHSPAESFQEEGRSHRRRARRRPN